MNGETNSKNMYKGNDDLIMKDFTEFAKKDDFVISVNNHTTQNNLNKIKNEISDKVLESVVEKCKPEISCKKIKVSSN